MKVFTCPEAVQFVGHDYTNFDIDNENRMIADHKDRLKNWLIKQGYSGKLTGEVVGFGVADGEAQYMVGDKGANGRGIILIHLPYWDAYQYIYAARLTKRDIVEKIEYDRKISALFKKG